MAQEFDLGLLFQIVGANKAHQDIANLTGKTKKAMSGGQKSVNDFGQSFVKLGAMISSARQILQTFDQAIAQFDPFINFEKSLASLSAITGATGEDLEFFNQKAKEIAATTTIGASDAVKAFELIGSAKPELLKSKEALAGVTQEAISLAEASGLTLPKAAQALTGALNQYGAGADKAAKFVNILAAGSKAGAVAVPQVTEALKNFGVQAASANISIEESVGLIEVLGEKQIQGSEAGIKLRNVLTKLQTGADKFNPKIVGMRKALDNLAAANLSTTEFTKMFTAENALAAQVLIENREQFTELTKAVTDTGVAYEQQAVNAKTTAAQLAKLKNQYEVLKIEIGAKLAPVLRSFLSVVAKVLKFVSENKRLVLSLAGGIAAVVVVVKAWAIAQSLLNKQLVFSPIGAIAAGIGLLTTAMIGLTEQTNEATKATQGFAAVAEKERRRQNRTLFFDPKDAEKIKEEVQSILSGTSDGVELLVSLQTRLADEQKKVNDLFDQGATNISQYGSEISRNYNRALSESIALRNAINSINSALERRKDIEAQIAAERAKRSGAAATGIIRPTAGFQFEDFGLPDFEAIDISFMDDLAAKIKELSRLWEEMMGKPLEALGGREATDAMLRQQEAMNRYRMAAIDLRNEFPVLGEAMADLIGKNFEAIGSFDKAAELAEFFHQAINDLREGIKQTITQGMADLVSGLGRAAAMGENAGDAIRAFMKALLSEVPRLVGMFLLTSGVQMVMSGVPFPAALPFVVGGLGLVALSGFTGGLIDKLAARAGVDNAPLRPPAAAPVSLGLGSFGQSGFEGVNVQTQVFVSIGDQAIDDMWINSRERYIKRRGK